METRLNDKGLSLIELMIVLVLIAVGILTLSGVQTRSYTDVHQTGLYTRALDVGEMQMEIARAAGFTNAQSDSGIVTNINWRRLVASEGAGLSRVTVRVWWTEGGQTQSLELVSLLSAR
jgi:prepilin-type N-terminal cleavage/methylation domain-containing protein